MAKRKRKQVVEIFLDVEQCLCFVSDMAKPGTNRASAGRAYKLRMFHASSILILFSAFKGALRAPGLQLCQRER